MEVSTDENLNTILGHFANEENRNIPNHRNCVAVETLFRGEKAFWDILRERKTKMSQTTGIAAVGILFRSEKAFWDILRARKTEMSQTTGIA